VKDYSLQELRFQFRVFLKYSDYLETLKAQGAFQVDDETQIEMEISRTISRIEDLTILVMRRNIEEGETQRQST